MAFDEEGQADTVERKVAICERAYRLLTEQAGFDPDRHHLRPEHPRRRDRHRGARRVRDQLHRGDAADQGDAAPARRSPAASSNLSFSFRGNDAVREAMHSAFLYHAIQAGMDMGIVNAGQLAVYEDIPKELLEHVEDVLFNRRPDATERLVEFAEPVKRQGARSASSTSAWREAPVEERLSHALVHGIVDFIEDDTEEARQQLRAPARRDRGPADGRHEGRRRPVRRGQDVPAAGREERARDEEGGRLPEPFMEAEKADQRRRPGKIVMATVKGDVHDIGKNIVGVVLGCNGYEVIDLGVMVPCDRILDAVEAESADMIGLSGLITPSLDEMVHVAREMERRGIRSPLLIGGATTSRQHTAVKIAPAFAGPTVHVLDASRAVGVVSSLLSEERRDAFVATNVGRAGAPARQPTPDELARPLLAVRRSPGAAACALDSRPRSSPEAGVPRPAHAATTCRSRRSARYIDWTFFFPAWELKGKFPKILDDPDVGAAARELYEHAPDAARRIVDEKLLRAHGRLRLLAGATPTATTSCSGPTRAATPKLARFPMLRQQRAAEGKPRLVAGRLRRAGRERRGRLRRRLRVTAGHRRRRARRALRGGARRLPRDHGQGARRPAGRGVRRVAARARAPRVGLRRRRAALARGSDRRALPRHPAGVRLSGLPGPHREAAPLRAARRARPGHHADRELRDDAGRERQRPLLRAPGGALLHRRSDRPRPGRGLRGAQGDAAGRSGALARAESRLRAGAARSERRAGLRDGRLERHRTRDDRRPALRRRARAELSRGVRLPAARTWAWISRTRRRGRGSPPRSSRRCAISPATAWCSSTPPGC